MDRLKNSLPTCKVLILLDKLKEQTASYPSELLKNRRALFLAQAAEKRRAASAHAARPR
jgi:hypothetical protein